MKTASSTERALVLGFGASGKAAARLLVKHGWHVTVWDERAVASDPAIRELFANGQVSLAEKPGQVHAGIYTLAVVSPGFPVEHPWLVALRDAGIRLVPEFQWGLEHLPDVNVIAVTGSNGKSSLVKWMADTLCISGKSAVPAGNYGLPVCAIALEDTPPEYLVVELSSFQLELASPFNPQTAILLNIAPNHLDRHRDMEAYVKAKAKLFAGMVGGGLILAHAPSWQQITPYVPEPLSPVMFDRGKQEAYGFGDEAVFRQGERFVDLRGTWWGREPMGVNAAAGVAALERAGVDAATMESSAKSFVPLPHRLELVAEHKGIVFVNDSKSSTMSALVAALSTGPEKKHLIAGGILKEMDVNFVKEFLVKSCAGVYAIGSSADKIVSAWQEVVPCVVSGDLSTAVKQAYARARSGELIMLSPGCSSFDQFESYARRGEKFKEEVLRLIQHSETMEKTMQGVRT